jgi:hypothetical protein
VAEFQAGSSQTGGERSGATNTSTTGTMELRDLGGQSRRRDDARQPKDSSLAVSARDFAITKEHESNNKQPLWLIPCFKSSDGPKAFHEDVTGGRYDFELFSRFREIYFEEKSWFRRFFDLTEVKDIKFINVSSVRSSFKYRTNLPHVRSAFHRNH